MFPHGLNEAAGQPDWERLVSWVLIQGHMGSDSRTCFCGYSRDERLKDSGR